MSARRIATALAAVLPLAAHAGSGSVNNDGTIDMTANLRFPPTSADLSEVRTQLEDASRVLWDASEGQLRFGQITIDCGAVDEDLADVWVKPGTGRAGVSYWFDGSGLGRRGAHIDQFLQSSTDIVFAHEFGHLALGLGDEYDEQSRFGNCWGYGPCLDSGTDEQNNCLMEQTAGTSQTEFCVQSNHDATQGEGTPCTPGAAPCTDNCRLYNPTTGRYETTQQQDNVGVDCWTHLTNNFGFLNAPQNLPTAAPPGGFTAPTFVDDCEATDTVLLVLDRSGSMAWGTSARDEEVCGNTIDDDDDGDIDENDCSESRLDFLKGAAKAWLSLAVGENVDVGIVSFSETASTEQGFATLDAGNRFDYDRAVDALDPGTGTAIGRALSSTTLLFGGLSGTSSKTIFLISDGQNTVGEPPNNVVEDLQDQDIRVFTISTGSASDDATLTQISGATQGRRVDARDASELILLFVQQWAHYRNDPVLVPNHPWVVNPVNANEQLDEGLDVTDWSDGSADTLDLSDTNVQGDLFDLMVPPDTDEISLVFSGDDRDLTDFGLEVTLTGPGGTTLDTEAGDPSLEVVRGDVFVMVQVTAPTAGPWSFELRRSSGAATHQSGHLTVIADAPRADLFPDVEDAFTGPASTLELTSKAIWDTTLWDLDEVSAVVETPTGSFDVVPMASDRPFGGAADPTGVYMTGNDRGLYQVRFLARTGSGTRNDPGESIWAPAPDNSVPVPDLALQDSRSFWMFEGEPACTSGNPDDCDGDCVIGESTTEDADEDFLPDAYDTDSDGDEIPDGAETVGCQPVDSDDDGRPDHLDVDSDDDGILDADDNCRRVQNEPQADADDDGLGDVCDPCPDDTGNDVDGDGVCAATDLCPDTADPAQDDTDGDGTGDACDPCLADPDDDADGDGTCGDVDNCPATPNADQLDTDGDGAGDACDPCPADADDDADDDGVCGDVDNCPATANPDQVDSDGDGEGDACDEAPSCAGCSAGGGLAPVWLLALTAAAVRRRRRT